MDRVRNYNQEILILYNQGYSVAQITKRLGTSISSVRNRLDKSGIKRRTISEAITNWHITKFNKQPFRVKTKLSPNEKELKIAGIMLYWGEGSKKTNVVDFVNSDPEMIKVFLSFLRKICGVSEKRLRALVHLYPDHNEREVLRFWSKTTQIPLSQFNKSFIHTGKRGTYKKRAKYGTLSLRYSDRQLLNLLLRWIDEYKGKFITTAGVAQW